MAHPQVLVITPIHRKERLNWPAGLSINLNGALWARSGSQSGVDATNWKAAMNTIDETWQPARLFPVTGIGGADEQERRGCSAFLAVIRSVNEFGRALTLRCGAPAGTIETYIEVPFTLGDAKYRPDGLIRVTRGKRTWTALVEVKTGVNDLKIEQVGCYVDIAREQGFDAVITVSHQIAATPGVHPVALPKSKLKKVNLYHLSWGRIHTEALIEHANKTVSDPDQAWILSEFVRYVENPKSGALDFDGMGPSWVGVREAAARNTLRAADPVTTDVVARFDQLVAFAAMELSRRLGVQVQQRLSRRELTDQALGVQSQAARLEETGQLSGTLMVPNAAAAIDVSADLRAGRIACSATLSAPDEGRPQTRVNWLLRQLKDAPGDLMLTATPAWARDSGPCHPLSVVVESPAQLIENPHADLRSFTLTLSRPAGTKRGKASGSFVESVTAIVDQFYVDVVRHLKGWSPSPPKPKETSDDSAQEVEPPSKVQPANGLDDDGCTSEDAGTFSIALRSTDPWSPTIALESNQ